MIIFYIGLIIWCLIFIVYVLYLYFNNSKPYPNGLYEQIKTPPKQSNPAKLSMLVYKKVIPEVVTAIILILIKKGKLKLEQKNDKHYISKTDLEVKINVSQRFIIDLLIDTIGNGEKVSIDDIYHYCKNNRNCSNFLNDYKIWYKSILSELSNANYYEPKEVYGQIKFIRNTGIILFILNIVLKYNLVLGFFIIVPAIFIMIYFKNIYKRTKEANKEYNEWLSYGKYLLKTNVSNIEKEQIWNAYIYNLILNKTISHEIFSKINESIKRCFIRSNLYGNRSILKK